MAKNAELSSHPMRQICDAWLAKIEQALKVRHDKFGQYAEEAEKFFNGNHDWMWADSYARGGGGFLDKEGGVLPNFRITVNKLFEAVALYGPSLYHQNPNIQVSPTLPSPVPPSALGIDPADPYGMQEYQMLVAQEQYEQELKVTCAGLKERYLNWLQLENDKKAHSRKAIGETIVAGLSYLETSIYQPDGSSIKFPRSTYLSWEDVVVDPDASYWEDVQWIAIRRCRPVNLTEERFGLERGDLKGHMQSYAQQSTKKGKKEAKQGRKGQSFDLIEYWEVYSKNGFGDLLHDGSEIPKQHQFDYSVFGKYCHLAVSKGIPFPLNCPTSVLLEDDAMAMYERVQWPIPFWLDQDGWPITRFSFYDDPHCIWPISLFKPAIGELRFINWCLSFLADKVASSCTTYVGIMKSAGATIQKQINGQMTPFTVIEIAEALNMKLSEMVTFLQSPDFPESIWRMVAEVLELIDRRTGLSELLYGMTATSMRSATEANVKNQNLAIRPDDMASSVENSLSEVAVREMQAARWFVEPQDVEPVLGQMGAMVWQNYILTQDADQVVRCFDYRIEAGSARKPNKATKIAQLNEMGQTIGQVLAQFATEGAVGPFNAYVTELAKAHDMDPSPFLLPEPDPNQPSPEEQQLQMEMAIEVQRLQLAVQEMQAKLDMERESQEQELKHEEAMHALDVKEKKESLALKKAESKAKQQATKTAAKQKPKAGAK
jgi:hypothetical protein